jgi:uncharacterized protein
MKQRITDLLSEIEKTNSVKILYACESGSRAWGFESADSDYDVRFIYLRPINWYLSIEAKRNVIELPINETLDVCGWDLHKALHLMRKSNPPLLEWLQSPIIYTQRNSCINKLRSIMPECYSPLACFYHYFQMAKNNYREYLQGEIVWLKKYLYVLRPLLACLWIEKDYGIVPMQFDALLERLITNNDLMQAIKKLVEQKKAGQELSKGQRIPLIATFIDTEIERISKIANFEKSAFPVKVIDKIFQECLIDVYGNKIEVPENR